MERVYTTVIRAHLKKNRQMAFIAGPRQVGKTTCSKMVATTFSSSNYMNWDNVSERKLIIQGPNKVANHCQLQLASKSDKLIIFDELHKYRKWKLFLKGFFDLYENLSRMIVTGSAKLDIYRRGGDSLMGRYFLYRIHPLSVSELLSITERQSEIIQSQQLSENKLQNLFTFGGFPENYIKADTQFSHQWQRLRKQQLLREDIRELSQIHNLSELEFLMDLLIEEAGNQLNIATLANQLNVAQTTVDRWIKTLQSFYYCYTVKPWFKNIRRSIRKMPKVYLWDWSMITDPGKKYENFIASHLLKAVNYWTDCGFGEYDLYYLRDKERHEVDFLVLKNKKPWFLVEAKLSSEKLSDNLNYYQQQLNAPHAFQVVMNMDYIDVDCFQYHRPIVVPASTFLSQLV